MEKIPRLNVEQRSNLVAYLDGELAEPQAKEIEQVLSKSPTVRYDVEMLTRAWTMLDHLPRVSGSSELTARTLTAVKQDDSPATWMPPGWLARFPKERFRRGAIAGTWLTGLVLSAVLGFAITNRVIPNESDELLRKLPLIEKLDLYSNVGSIEFLRELDKRIGSFDESKKIGN